MSSNVNVVNCAMNGGYSFHGSQITPYSAIVQLNSSIPLPLSSGLNHYPFVLMKPIRSITYSNFIEVSCGGKPQRIWNFIWYMEVLRYLLIKCHRANILTIRNMRFIPLGECIFNVYRLQFDSLCQVESISVLSHANLPQNVYMLSIQKNPPKSPKH